MSWEMQLDENLLEDLYKWLDTLPLTRPKKSIERDFQDGKLVAEIVHYYLSDLIDINYYNTANSLEHKRSNWFHLNQKVLTNLGLDLSDVLINGLSNGKPGLIEVLLFNLRLKIDEQLELKDKSSRHTALSKSFSRNSNIKSHLISSSPSSSLLVSKKSNLSSIDYEEIKQEYFEQEEQIERLQAKLRRLEHLLKLKDIRINQLNQTLHEDNNKIKQK